jgi:hypothetical protein
MARTTATTKTATIANTGTTSQAVHLGDTAILGIEMPATVTGTALAIHGCSTSGGTFKAIKDSTGTANAFVVAANEGYWVDPRLTAGFPWIKIVMAAQSQETIVTLLTRPV